MGSLFHGLWNKFGPYDNKVEFHPSQLNNQLDCIVPLWKKTTPLKTNMRLENPHVQYRKYIDSFMVDFPKSRISFRGE